MIRKLKTFDLKLRPGTYAKEREVNYNKHYEHMFTNCIFYEFEDGSTPLFFNQIKEIPNYIPGEKIHTIEKREIGRLDLIAWKYYKNPEYLWIIAFINDIDPLDMQEGITLRILPKDWIIFNIFRHDLN